MREMMTRVAFLQALLAHSDHLRELLGDDWADFLGRLHPLLARLMRADTEGLKDDQVLLQVDQLTGIALDSPASPLVKELLRQAAEQADQDDDIRRSMRTKDPTSGQSREFPLAPATSVRMEDEASEAMRGDVVAAGRDLAVSLPPERFVNTGFAEALEPTNPIARTRTLAIDQSYYFWLEIGSIIEGTIEDQPTELPIDDLPPEAELRVAVFSFKDEIAVTPGADVGGLKIQPDQSVTVAQPVEAESPIARDSDLGSRRLLFPVRTPSSAGVHRLRCNIYYEQILVQSRLIRAEVSATPEERPRALRSEVDFALSHSLSSRHLRGMPRHLLSLMMNDNGDGTHGFRFFGQKEFKTDAEFDGQALQNLIDQARGAMRQVAWGDDNQWSNQAYRYEPPAPDTAPQFDRAKLTADFLVLAKRGYRFFAYTVQRLAGADAGDGLIELMREPGLVQIALKKSAAHIIPAALIYDHPLDTTLPSTKYSLCPSFWGDLESETDLTTSACFQGDCPSHGQDTVICPSGFWGFRHELGLSVDIGNAPDLPNAIPFEDAPRLTIGVSTDAAFLERAGHETRLRELLGDANWHYADNRDDALSLLGQVPNELVYFYCHGGLTDEKLPYIELGAPGSWGYITADNLLAKRIRWTAPRPLVFINGCHTTAVEPEQALNLVSGFVGFANAAGVIGSEITLFEPLAVSFAETFFAQVIKEVPVGKAVRTARLALLQQGNPLGLVYIPFVQAGLQLSKI